MDLKLQGKKVAVTGAAGSIGQVFVKDLLKHGAIVYAISRTASKLDDLVNKNPSSSLIPIVCDLEKWKEAEDILTQKIPDDIDMLVNNAGAARNETIDEITEEAVDEVLNVNLKGTLCITKVVVKKMKARGMGGSIVNVSSLSSDFPCGFLLAYSMTKAGINRLTKTLAFELGPHGIRVNAVNPTVIYNTNMGDAAFDSNEKKAIIKLLTPLQTHVPTSEDVSDAVLFLLSERARSITGQITFVDCGTHGG